MTIKRIICCALVAALCALTLGSCGYNPETVVTVDGFDIPAGVYLSYQYNAASEAMDKYYTASGEYVTGREIFSQEIEGVPARDWIKEKTLDACRRYVFFDREFERLGLTLEDGSSYYLDYIVDYQWSSVSASFEKNGISLDTYRELYYNYTKQEMVLNALYGTDGEKALPDEDKTAYYNEHFATMDVIQFPSVDASGASLDSDAHAKLAEAAADMLESARASGSLEKAYLANWAKVNAITGDASAVDAAGYDGLVSTDVVISDLLTTYETPMAEAALAAGAGGFDIYDNGSSIYIFKSNGPSEGEYDSYESYVISGLAADPFEEYVKENIAKYEVAEDARAVKYYSPDNIRFS